ncbi:MAG: hypothetical protein V4629_13290 [Pseudomonadota bacterium]
MDDLNQDHKDASATITKWHSLSAGVEHIFLKIKGATHSHQAGQYLMILVADLWLPFSIANDATSEKNSTQHVELFIRMRHSEMLEILKQGFSKKIKWQVRYPQGRMFLPTFPTPLLFFAFGTGISPMRSFLQRCVAIKWTQPIQCIWATAHPNRFFLDDFFVEMQKYLKLDMRRIVCASNDTDVLIEQVFAEIPKNQRMHNTHVYLAASYEAVIKINNELRGRGWEEQYIHSDLI